MVFMHFKIIAEGLTVSFVQPMRFESSITKGILCPDVYCKDLADLYIFSDSYKDILYQLKFLFSVGLLKDLSTPSIMYLGSSEDSFCSTFDVYNLYFKEEEI